MLSEMKRNDSECGRSVMHTFDEFPKSEKRGKKNERTIEEEKRFQTNDIIPPMKQFRYEVDP